MSNQSKELNPCELYKYMDFAREFNDNASVVLYVEAREFLEEKDKQIAELQEELERLKHGLDTVHALIYVKDFYGQEVILEKIEEVLEGNSNE